MTTHPVLLMAVTAFPSSQSCQHVTALCILFVKTRINP